MQLRKRQFKVPLFSHPVQSAGSYVEYVINHNLGQKDVITKLYQYPSNNPANRLDLRDVDNAPTHTYGHIIQTTDENTCKLYIYRVNGTYTVYVDGYIEQA